MLGFVFPGKSMQRGMRTRSAAKDGRKASGKEATTLMFLSFSFQSAGNPSATCFARCAIHNAQFTITDKVYLRHRRLWARNVNHMRISNPDR
jgi:hypothetical protein